MSDTNIVILGGRLGKDPELKETSNKKKYLLMSLATNQRWKNDADVHERVDWHTVKVWDKLAEVCAEKLSKGDHVLVEGRLQADSWKDKSGEMKHSVNVIAEQIDFVSVSKKISVPTPTQESLQNNF